MDGPLPPPRRPGARVARALLALALLSPAAAQEAGGRPDQVFRRNPRTGVVSTLSGVITENSLTQVVVENEGRPDDVNSAEVVRVVWGRVPTSYRDGRTFFERGDFENAVARFQVAAGDDETRDVVRADARLKAAAALLAWGASDPNRFAEAAAEAERFLSEYPASRDVPEARRLEARATWLAGDPAAAAGLYEALYREGASEPPTSGYERAACLEAGLRAAEASLVNADTGKARELYTALEVAFQQAASAVEDPASPLRARLVAGAGEAAVGEGFCLLAGGQANRALDFFERAKGDGDAPSAARFAATLGLAEALRAAGRLRESQVQFAAVSALDHTDRDRVARALVGLADVTLKLDDSNANASAKTWLGLVAEQYGDTPAAAQAAALLQNL